MPAIDRNSTAPFYLQIYEQVSTGIENGSYQAGNKLPSIRECARELGVSNTTVELAYQRLSEEGYVQARRGSGYVICKVNPAPKSKFDRFCDAYRRDLESLIRAEEEQMNTPAPDYDFAYDSVDASLFPFTTWARICREVFFTPESGDACLYNDRQGLRALREQIADYLSAEYGLSCVAEQVLVMPTTRELVTEVTSLFNPASTTVAMGNPGYDEVGKRLRDRGYRVQPIPVFPYPSWEQALEALQGATVVFATPASQFPTNQSMSFEMRGALVEWAQDHDAYLIDDEYSWEYQTGVARMPSLASLDDEGRVITMGTFSNSFTPAVCLSYAVLPPQLMLTWQATRRNKHPQVPWQTQASMANFMREGHWRKHIRKTRTAIIKKRQLLRTATEQYLGNAVETIEGPCSLFMLVQTRDGRSEGSLIEAAAAAGVRVYPTSQYWNSKPPDNWRYVLVGYASIPVEDIESGIRALASAWNLA